MDSLKNRKVLDHSAVPESSKDEEDETEIANMYTTEEFRNYSRKLHKKQPKNYFFKQKIPWKTIIACIIFFILGSLFLGIGIHKWVLTSLSECYEFLLLGLIMFIPGSYHTFLLIQILRGVPEYTYDLLDVFDQE
ncbi:unnamed protein product [Moneuplotes crassus]|uniref:Transmembrane protein 230 n=1 Tax=Euplotes crassus TaxID=5936 RepID=A0AAD2D7S6_EUPCR|nr:unnamed protein product [Moneuplotes crassus]